MKVLRSGMDTKKSLPIIQVINFYTNEYNTTRLKWNWILEKNILFLGHFRLNTKQ